MRDRIKASDWLRAGLLLSGAIGQTFSGFLPDALGWEVSIASRSAEFNTLLIPSGWAFLIWLPLFFGNIAFAIYHAFPKQLTDPLMRAVGWLAAAAFWANAVRSLYQPLAGPDWISFVMLEAILAPLLIAAVIIARAGATGLGRKVALAFVVAQAGWISVASPAGFSQMALYEG